MSDDKHKDQIEFLAHLCDLAEGARAAAGRNADYHK